MTVPLRGAAWAQSPDAPKSNLIWGPRPSRLNFSCFQFELGTCAALVIYTTTNISCLQPAALYVGNLSVFVDLLRT